MSNSISKRNDQEKRTSFLSLKALENTLLKNSIKINVEKLQLKNAKECHVFKTREQNSQMLHWSTLGDTFSMSTYIRPIIQVLPEGSLERVEPIHKGEIRPLPRSF